MQTTLGAVPHRAYLTLLQNQKFAALQWAIDYAPCMCPEVVKLDSKKTDSQYGEQFTQFLIRKAIHRLLRARNTFRHPLETSCCKTPFPDGLSGIQPLRKLSRKLSFPDRLYTRTY